MYPWAVATKPAARANTTGREKASGTTVTKRQAQVVKELLQKVERKLSKDGVKATLGDYIRLVQLEKELAEEEPKEIRVTWVEPEKKESDSEK